MANAVVASMRSATIDTTNKYVSFASNESTNHVIVGYGATDPTTILFKFKENTRYTFIITYSKSSSVSPNIKIAYTDGTSENIPSLSSASAKETVVAVSAVGKTVRSVFKSNMSGTTYLYYNESGIFEGVLTAADFEEWRGTLYSVLFPAFGKNLFNPSFAEPGYYTDIGANHAQSGSNYEYRMKNYVPLGDAEKVTVGYAALPSGSTKWNSVCWYDENKTFISRSADTSGSGLSVFTVPANAKYVRGNMRTFNQGVQYCFLALGEETFELCDNMAYLGTFDMLTGILTVKWVRKLLNGSESWQVVSSSSNPKYFRTKIGPYGYVVSGSNISDKFKQATINTSTSYIGVNTGNSSSANASHISIRPGVSGISSYTDLKNWLAQNNVDVVYELATPLTYQLDSIFDIESFVGKNTVFSDMNDNIKLTYLKRGS